MALVVCALAAPARGQHTAAPSALFTAGNPAGWTAAVELRTGSREFVGAGQLLATDLRLISARVGVHLLPYLTPWIEAGTSLADRETYAGENGALFGGGLDAELVQWILTGNPSLERKRLLTLGARMALRRAESNSAEADFHWTEFELAPGVTYTRNVLGDGAWIPYQPLETQVRGHLVYSQIDGSFGPADVEGNRNFGFRLGVDLYWLHQVTTSLEGTFYGDKDRLLGLSLGVHF